MEKNKAKKTVINILDTLLTSLNVTRLLARPEQWAGNYPKTYAGQDRTKHDSARLMFDDLMGRKSVDIYPSFMQFLGWKLFDLNAIDDQFFGPKGVMQFHQSALMANDNYGPEHWNGGIHYYYWTGAMGQWLGDITTPVPGPGRAGVAGAMTYEFSLKLLGKNPRRSIVQLGSGFKKGAAAMRQLETSLTELKRFDKRLVID